MSFLGSMLAVASIVLITWWGSRDALDAVTTPDEKPDGTPKFRHYSRDGRVQDVWENE